MKIIHVADLHLDSKLTANLPEDKRKIRKNEVLHSFARLVSYAAENEVSAVLIAGDLFDSTNISRAARDAVVAAIKSAPNLQFYYLRGNHDEGGSLTDENLPNLHFFSDEWVSYSLEASGTVILTGAELGRLSGRAAAASLILDESKVNIVMLHGQEVPAAVKADDIPVKDFKNRGIDYLALGHVHFYKEEALDGRGIYAYPGALEGRGFDECGEHGFILIDINMQTRAMTHSFIPFAKRRLYEVSVNISGLENAAEALKMARAELAKVCPGPESLLKIVLTGEVSADALIDTAYIETALENEYFFVKVVDKTTLLINYDDFAGDISLRGEFVRRVQNSDLSEKEKAEIIRCGIRALSGEEVFA